MSIASASVAMVDSTLPASVVWSRLNVWCELFPLVVSEKRASSEMCAHTSWVAW